VKILKQVKNSYLSNNLKEIHKPRLFYSAAARISWKKIINRIILESTLLADLSDSQFFSNQLEIDQVNIIIHIIRIAAKREIRIYF